MPDEDDDQITVKVDTQNPEKPAEVIDTTPTDSNVPEQKETPVTPEPEEVKEIPKDISFESFEEVLDKASVKTKPKEEKKTPEVTPPKKEEATPSQPKKKDTDLTEPVEKKTEAQSRQERLTAEGIDGEFHEVLSQMSNTAFEKIIPILKEHTSLKKELEETRAKVQEPVHSPFYEHERGYVLTPEWEEINQDANALEYVKAHWMEQAAKIENGEDWQDLDIDKDGKFVKSAPLPSNTKAKIYANQNLLSIQASEQTIKTRASEIIKGHKSRYQAATGKVTEIVDKYLKKYDDPKSPFNGVIKNVLDTVPKEFHNHPMTRAFALLVANMIETRLIYENTLKKLQTDGSFKEQAKKSGAGPSGKEINTGTPSKAPTPYANVKFDDFETILR